MLVTRSRGFAIGGRSHGESAAVHVAQGDDGAFIGTVVHASPAPQEEEGLVELLHPSGRRAAR